MLVEFDWAVMWTWAISILAAAAFSTALVLIALRAFAGVYTGPKYRGLSSGLDRYDFPDFDTLQHYWEQAFIDGTFHGKSTKVIGTTLYVWSRKR